MSAPLAVDTNGSRPQPQVTAQCVTFRCLDRAWPGTDRTVKAAVCVRDISLDKTDPKSAGHRYVEFRSQRPIGTTTRLPEGQAVCADLILVDLDAETGTAGQSASAGLRRRRANRYPFLHVLAD